MRWSHWRFLCREGAQFNALDKAHLLTFLRDGSREDKHRHSVTFKEATKVILVRQRWQLEEMSKGRWQKGLELCIYSEGAANRVP